MCLYIFEILKLKSNYKSNVNIFILKIAINKINKNRLLLSFTLLKYKGLNFTYHSYIFHMPGTSQRQKRASAPYSWATGPCDLPPVGAGNSSTPLQEPKERLTDDISPAPTKTLFCFLRQFSFVAQAGPE